MFGLRPAQLDLQSWPNGVLVNSSKKPGGKTWVEPPVQTPAVELLVRDPKDSLASDPLAGWHRVEGVEAGNYGAVTEAGQEVTTFTINAR